jgi:hypothetical protein
MHEYVCVQFYTVCVHKYVPTSSTSKYKKLYETHPGVPGGYSQRVLNLDLLLYLVYMLSSNYYSCSTWVLPRIYSTTASKLYRSRSPRYLCLGDSRILSLPVSLQL